jgi:high-affinity nickel-transport protein
MCAPLVLERSQANGTAQQSWLKSKASCLQKRVPGIRELPLPAVSIIVLLIFVNVAVWIAVGIVLVRSIR